MKLWLIVSLINSGYDHINRAVVRAETEEEARRILSTEGGGWSGEPEVLDANSYSCVVLEADGKPEIVVCDMPEG
jgi:hypothetical protein